MDASQRIAQFENMVQADPTNDMAHFSLGNAYAQAGRHADAARSFEECARLNPAMSKAYQLAGAAWIAAGDRDHAALILAQGYQTAAQRGDLMPKKAIADLLAKIDAPVPEVKGAAPQAGPATATGGFVCARTGRPGTRMARPPFRGPIGAWIAQNISQETFNDWIAQGTKVINELRLDLSRDQDEAVYDQHMREYLGIDDELFQKLSAQV